MTARMRLAWLPREEFARILNGVPHRQDRAQAFATLSRINTLYMITRAGSGHVGSSFSAADIVSWLLLEETRGLGEEAGDVYFSSKGHDVPGLYASLIGLGGLPEELVHQLRRLDGLPGHPDVGTPHMPFNTGSLGMGVSKAKGLILADRLSGRSRKVYVLTGDGELQEGQIWESLPSAAHLAMGELTVIVDHNKIQSDTWVRDVNDLGDLEARFAACGWGVLRCDGHDVAQLEETFLRRARDFPGRPVAVIADTVKGAGVTRFAATSMTPGEWRYRFHSGAPSPQDYATAHDELTKSADRLLARHGLDALRLRSVDVPVPVAVAAPRLPEVYGRALTEAAARDERLVALDADLVLDTGLIPFRDAHPDRFVECGIAEQDMVSTAGGLAAGGLLPFVHSFSCFLHSRPNEQIYNNATERRRVVYVGSLAGLLPATPGHSHQAVRDIAALAAVPGLVLLAPGSPTQTEAAVDYCRTASDSVYLRLSSMPCSPEVAQLASEPLATGRGEVVRTGSGRIVLVGAGPVMLTELLRAADALAADGIDVTVVNLPWLNRVDGGWLEDITSDADWLFVAEEHYERGGQADVLARALLELGPRRAPRFRGIGLTGIPQCGTPNEVLGAHGLRADLLAHEVCERVRETSAV